VYFNSAGFNGHQFLSDEARNAGYNIPSMKPDPSIVEKGIASIVEQDIPSMIHAAEDGLLQALVRSSPARTTARNMLDARSAVGSGNDILWSCPDKEWLFQRLVGDSKVLPTDSTQLGKLRTILADLPDVPKGAFADAETIALLQNHTKNTAPQQAFPDRETISLLQNNTNNSHGAPLPANPNGSQNSSAVDSALSTHDCIANSTLQSDPDQNNDSSKTISNLASPGTLDAFFEEEPNSDDVIGGNVTGELVVQEILVNLLWASTAMKVDLLRKELTMLLRTTDAGSLNETSLALSTNGSFNGESSSNDDSDEEDEPLLSVDTSSLAVNRTSTRLNSVTEDPAASLQLKEREKELVVQIRDTTNSLLALKLSAQRITRRLLDQSNSNGLEGKMSASLQADLANRVDDHVRGICSTEEEGFVADSDEPYEVALERIAEEWGEWFDDEYVWSPSDGGQTSFPDLDGDNDQENETLEEGLDRIDREWAGWLD